MRVLILCIASLTLLNSAGCSPKIDVQREYIYYIPEKIPVPEKPKLLTYNREQRLDSPENFKKIQQNTVFLIDYANSLKSVIQQYESTIDEFQKVKESYMLSKKK